MSNSSAPRKVCLVLNWRKQENSEKLEQENSHRIRAPGVSAKTYKCNISFLAFSAVFSRGAFCLLIRVVNNQGGRKRHKSRLSHPPPPLRLRCPFPRLVNKRQSNRGAGHVFSKGIGKEGSIGQRDMFS